MVTKKRLTIAILISFSMAFGFLMQKNNGKEKVTLSVQTCHSNLDCILAESVNQISKLTIRDGNVTVIIKLNGNQIVACYQIKDAQKLIKNNISMDEFIRHCVIFS